MNNAVLAQLYVWRSCKFFSFIFCYKSLYISNKVFFQQLLTTFKIFRPKAQQKFLSHLR